MRQRIGLILLVIGVSVFGAVPNLFAQVPLEDQLKAQYTFVKMGADTGGAAVVEQGTILVIKKGGILSVPYGDQPSATHYQDGVVHSPNAIMMKGIGFGMKKFGKEQTTRLMQVGEKVYPSKLSSICPKTRFC